MVKVPDYIANPALPITITVFGAGGTGSQLLMHLARIAVAYKALNNVDIHVMVFDGDKVSKSNVGRQLFSYNELGEYKAQVLVSRINRFYGFNWIAINEHFSFTDAKDINEQHQLMRLAGSNFLITCTDNVSSRKEVQAFYNYCQKAYRNDDEFMPYFWVDCGNTHRTGQFIVGSKIMGWPDVLEEYEEYYPETVEDEPSCSLAMALSRQDLFINTTVAMHATIWLRDCLMAKQIDYRGVFINLDTLRTAKIKVHAYKEGVNNREHTGQSERDTEAN